MKTITQTYHIKAPIAEVWQALVNPVYINKWGGGPVIMNDKKGTEFSLWGGEIFGKNLQVTMGKKLVQEWFGGNWDTPSIATFTLYTEKDGTRVELLQESVPDNEAKEIEDGWDEYYLGPLKEYLEDQ